MTEIPENLLYSAFNDNRQIEIEQKRNAGEAISCAYEWSVKYHLFHLADNIQQDWKDNDFFREDIKYTVN